MIKFEMLKCRNRKMRRKVNLAIQWSNIVINSELFKNKLKLYVDEFDYSLEADGTGITGAEMYDILSKSNNTFYVNVYRKWWWPFANTCGYFVTGNVIHVNYYYLKQVGIGSIVATIVHEGIHAQDEVNPSDSYGHGDNSPIGKEESAPYRIDVIASETYEEL